MIGGKETNQFKCYNTNNIFFARFVSSQICDDRSQRVFFCVNDVMCRMLWCHLSSFLYRGGLIALSVLHKFEGLIDSTSHNYWYLRNPPPLQALQINHERDSALKRMGSLETSGRREAFFFRIFVARLTCIVKKKAPRLPRAPRRSHAQTNKGRGILGSSSKRRFVCLKQEAT